MTDAPPSGPEVTADETPEERDARRAAARHRARRRLTLAAEIAGVVSAVAAMLTIAISIARDDGSDGEPVDTVAFEGKPTGEVLDYEDYLERSGLDPSQADPDDRKRSGAWVKFQLRSTGYENISLPLHALVVADGELVGRDTSRDFTPQAEEDECTCSVFVFLERSQPPYTATIAIFPPPHEGNVPLDEAETAAFRPR